MHVVHLITGLTTGGAEMMLYRLLGALAEQSIDCSVISLRDTGTLGTAISELGVPVHTLNLNPSRPDPRRLWQLRRLLHVLQPDVLHSWMYHANLAAALTANAPLLWSIHQCLDNWNGEKPLTRTVIRAGRYLAWRAAAILYHSQASATQHEAIGYPVAQRVLLPLGFDTARFQPDPTARQRLRAELGLATETRLFGLVGRYHPMKDYGNFLAAAAIVCARQPHAHAVCIGPGVTLENAELTQQINKLKLNGRVHLLGERRDIPALMAGLDVYVSSSFSESFPLVLGEALAAGVPVVATDVGESRQIVADSGRLVPPRNAEALAAGVNELLALEPAAWAALSLTARARVERTFALPVVAGRFVALYQSLVIRS